MKQIAVFIDGTAQQGREGSATNTNVYKLSQSFKGRYCMYFPGVGTNLTTKISGRLFARGMAKLIREAYSWLSSCYEPGDQVFLFGFSRGAFAVRSLAGFADIVGLQLEHHTSETVESAYQIYQNHWEYGQLHLKSYLRKLERPKQTREGPLKVHFIGVWDTVAAVGLPRDASRITAHFTAHHRTGLPSNIDIACHALAMHELRKDFEPLLFEGPSRLGQVIRQAWFPGGHGDVGGGYPETHWSDKALTWIADEARSEGLVIDRTMSSAWSTGSSEMASFVIHHEIKKLFLLVKPVIRTVLAEREDLPPVSRDTFQIHESVNEYLRAIRPGAHAFLPPEVNDVLGSIDREAFRFVAEDDKCISAAGTDAKKFILQTGKPTKSEGDALHRALSILVLCGQDGPFTQFLQSAVAVIREKHRQAQEAAYRKDEHELRFLNTWTIERLDPLIEMLKVTGSWIGSGGENGFAELQEERGKLKGRINAFMPRLR